MKKTGIRERILVKLLLSVDEESESDNPEQRSGFFQSTGNITLSRRTKTIT
jgi:hypothetical protein